MDTMLVVGSAPCLFDDVREALKLRPFAEIMLVNGACTAIESADHMLAGHEEKAEFFAEARRKKFPASPFPRYHGCTMEHRRNEMKHLCPSVTDWHLLEKGICATSASKAAKIAKYALGFEEVILCGNPLDNSGYFEGEGKGIPQNRSCLRVGDPGFSSHITPHHTGQYSTPPGTKMRVQESKIVQSYRTRFRQLAEGEFKGWVFSMSGFTREIFGSPPT
jgi:hypothetical protein